MTRLVTDQLYVDLDYFTPEEYYVYTAEAEGLLTEYIDAGYIDVDYYTGRGSNATLTCELTEVVGELVEANGAFVSQFSLVSTLGVIKSAEIELTVTSQVTAAISHIEGADLFAFSEAQLAVAVARIRDTNTAVALVFSVATSAGKILILSAEEDAVFTVSADAERSRAFSMDTQAAFSFVVDAGLVKTTAVDLSTDAAMSITGDRTVGIIAAVESVSAVAVSAEVTVDRAVAIAAVATLDSQVQLVAGLAATAGVETTLAAAVERLRGVDSIQVAEATVSAIISHIHGADIIASGFASLAANANVTLGITANITAVATQTTVPNFTTNGFANLFAGSALQANVSIRYDRPLTVSTNSAVSINNSIVKFGAGSLQFTGNGSFLNYFADGRLIPQLYVGQGQSTNFILELWFYPTVARTGPLIRYSDGTLNYWTLNGNLSFNYIRDTDGTIVTLTSSSSPVINQWNHILFVIDNTAIGAQHYSTYLNGSRTATGQISTQIRSNASNQGFLQISPTIDSNSPIGYIDEFRVVTGPINTASALGYATTQTTITQPTGEFTNSSLTRFLGHYNIDFRDDISEVKLFVADLSSVATVSAKLSGPVKYDAALTSTATLICFASKNQETVLGAFAEATVTADGNRIRFGDTNAIAEFAQTTNVINIKQISSDLAAEFDQAAQGDVTKLFDTALDTTTSVAVTAERTAVLDSSITSQFDQAVNVDKLTGFGADFTVSVAISVDILVTRNNDAVITSVATQATDADRLRGITESFTAEFQQAAENDTLRGVAAALVADFALIATPTGTVDGIVLQVSEFVQTATILRIQQSSVAINAAFAQSTDVVKAVENALAINTAFTQTTEQDRLRDNVIITDAIFSDLVAAGRIADFFINCDLVSSITTTAAITARATGNLNALVDVTTTGQLTRDVSVPMSTDTAMSVDGTTNITAEVIAGAAFTLAAEVNEVDQIAANLVSEFTLVANVDRNRGFASLVMSSGTVTVDANRTRDVVIETDAIFSEMTVGTKAVEIGAQITAQFAVTVNTSIVHIDEYVWVITAEDRIYDIVGETGYYKITGETRYHKLN